MSTDSTLLATLVRRVHLAIRHHINEDLRAAGFADLTPAHMYVLQTPGPEGARPTELALRTNMTKQAMNHLLGRLVQLGYLKRGPAADDGRGTVLHLTERGRDAQRIMLERAAELERVWAKKIGKRRLEDLRELLFALDALDAAAITP